MQEVLVKIQELHDTLVRKIADAQVVDQKQDGREKEQDRIELELKIKDKKLTVREGAVSHTESAKNMRDEAIAIEKKNNVERGELNEATHKHTEQVSKDRAETDSAREANEDWAASLKLREEAHIKAVADLEKKKKTYKEDAIKELQEKVK